MNFARLRPTFSSDYVGAARGHALDLASSAGLFFCASIMAGRIWRFPFDDELIALSPIERSHSAIELLSFYLKGGDIHPPLSFLWFYGLHHWGLSEASMRIGSVAMTAFSLGLFHLIALVLLTRRNGEPVVCLVPAGARPRRRHPLVPRVCVAGFAVCHAVSFWQQ
jgi:hypothetical protein